MLKIVLFKFLTLVCLSWAQKHEYELKKGEYSLKWLVDFDQDVIYFDVFAKTKGWVGLGLSLVEGMTGADIFIGGVYDNGTSYFDDYYGVGNSRPVKDTTNNWNLISAQETSSGTFLKISRPFNTCDEKLQDLVIDDRTITVIWAFGENDNINYHTSNRGHRDFYLLDPPQPRPDTSKMSKWEIRVNSSVSQTDDTVYWCNFHKSPIFDGKTYLIGFEPYLPSETAINHTYHLVVTRCLGKDLPQLLEPILENNPQGWNCQNTDSEFTKVHSKCREYHLFAWGQGASALFLPDDLGYPVGEDNENEYIMLEIHYDNIDLMQNIEFETGIDIYYTDSPWIMEASLFYIEQTFVSTHFIPPKLKEFTLSGHCDPQCSDNFPPDGINIFAYYLHSHYSGREMKIRHFRGDIELPWIAFDENYEFDYQQSRLARQEINYRPGDHMTIECEYDSSDRENVTIFGLRTSQEMCMAFLWFYPKVEIANCASKPILNEDFYKSLGIEELKNETESRNLYDPDISKPVQFSHLTYSEYLNTQVNWTKELTSKLEENFRFGQHIGKCIRKPEVYEPVLTKYPEIKQVYEEPIDETCFRTTENSTISTTMGMMSSTTTIRTTTTVNGTSSVMMTSTEEMTTTPKGNNGQNISNNFKLAFTCFTFYILAYFIII